MGLFYYSIIAADINLCCECRNVWHSVTNLAPVPTGPLCLTGSSWHWSCAVLVPAKTSIIFVPLKFVSVTYLADTKCNDLFIQSLRMLHRMCWEGSEEAGAKCLQMSTSIPLVLHQGWPGSWAATNSLILARSGCGGHLSSQLHRQDGTQNCLFVLKCLVECLRRLAPHYG